MFSNPYALFPEDLPAFPTPPMMAPGGYDPSHPYYIYSNPFMTPGMDDDFMSAGLFPGLPDPELLHDLGLMPDEAYDFLNNIHPFHHPSPVDFSPSGHDVDIDPTRAKLDEHNAIERERDAAVDKYNDAKRCGDYEEMLKWERIANDHQQALYNLWDTPQYGLPAKAPGIL